MTEDDRKLCFDLFKHLTTLDVAMLAFVGTSEKWLPMIPKWALAVSVLLLVGSIVGSVIAMLSLVVYRSWNKSDKQFVPWLMALSYAAFIFGIGLFAFMGIQP